jgi:hypothetical protein
MPQAKTIQWGRVLCVNESLARAGFSSFDLPADCTTTRGKGLPGHARTVYVIEQILPQSLSCRRVPHATTAQKPATGIRVNQEPMATALARMVVSMAR